MGRGRAGEEAVGVGGKGGSIREDLMGQEGGHLGEERAAL